MPPRNDPPKKFSKLLYFRGIFCQTQSQTPLLAPPTARHTEVFSFSPPCKLGEICRRPFGARGSSGRAMCPRAVLVPWHRSGRAACNRKNPAPCAFIIYVPAPVCYRSSEISPIFRTGKSVSFSMSSRTPYSL